MTNHLFYENQTHTKSVKLRTFLHQLKKKNTINGFSCFSGQCSCCKDTLDCLSLTDEEFTLLQQNVKEKLIVGSDLFLKTSPAELKRFSDFVEKTAPYDIVLDGLNIAYTAGVGNNMNKVKVLNNVVEHFVGQKKKILLLGRQHMMRWNKRIMQQIMNNTSFFFTDNL